MRNRIIKEGKFKGKKFCKVYKGFKECCPKSNSSLPIMYNEQEVEALLKNCVAIVGRGQIISFTEWWTLNKKK